LTFLFTDIERQTADGPEHPEAMSVRSSATTSCYGSDR